MDKNAKALALYGTLYKVVQEVSRTPLDPTHMPSPLDVATAYEYVCNAHAPQLPPYDALEMAGPRAYGHRSNFSASARRPPQFRHERGGSREKEWALFKTYMLICAFVSHWGVPNNMGTLFMPVS